MKRTLWIVCVALSPGAVQAQQADPVEAQVAVLAVAAQHARGSGWAGWRSAPTRPSWTSKCGISSRPDRQDSRARSPFPGGVA